MYDVLVVGGGAAGLSAALLASKKGAKVAVIAKSYPTRSQTCMAQGGINAALGNCGEDSVEAHIEDTLKSAKTLADEKMVRKLCEGAYGAIKWLDSLGVPFSRLRGGAIAQRRLGGASAVRACYAQDYTGLKILHTLYDAAIKSEIEFLNELFLLNFIVEENRVLGITAIDMRSGEVKALGAKSVIIASGGYCGLYKGYTTNSSLATADGLAAALRVGCKLSDMEFVQFHPTALKRSSVLISESARGAGGKLINSKGERFVDELKPRDVVAKAIWEQIESGEEVFLDIRELGEEFIDGHLPQERKLAILYEGVDPVKEPIPIKPVAHYTMGGIEVDENHMTSVDGLFAVGECSNAFVHGANRLGGNSLLETVVFGKEAGEKGLKYAREIKDTLCMEVIESKKKLEVEKLATLYEIEPKYNFYTYKDEIGQLFYSSVGILRAESGLKKAIDRLKEIEIDSVDMGILDKSRSFNTNLIDFLEFKNMIEAAKPVVLCALGREESRGAHQRFDFKEQSSEYDGVHSYVYYDENELKIVFKGQK